MLRGAKGFTMQNPAGSGERHCRRGEVRDMKVS